MVDGYNGQSKHDKRRKSQPKDVAANSALKTPAIKIIMNECLFLNCVGI